MKILDLLLRENRDKRLETFRIFSQHLPKYAVTLEKLYYNPNGINLAFLEDSAVAGGALGGYLNSRAAYLNFFLILPEFRARGFGKSLLGDFEARVKTDGRKTLECEALDLKVVNWFVKHGYKEITGRKDYSNILRQSNQVTLIKSLP